jgi:hypothetical protein
LNANNILFQPQHLFAALPEKITSKTSLLSGIPQHGVATRPSTGPGVVFFNYLK